MFDRNSSIAVLIKAIGLFSIGVAAWFALSNFEKSGEIQSSLYHVKWWVAGVFVIWGILKIIRGMGQTALLLLVLVMLIGVVGIRFPNEIAQFVQEQLRSGSDSEGMRTFTSNDGKTIEARIVMYLEPTNYIVIAREDGRTFNIPVARLSVEDQEWVKKWWGKKDD